MPQIHDQLGVKVDWGRCGTDTSRLAAKDTRYFVIASGLSSETYRFYRVLDSDFICSLHTESHVVPASVDSILPIPVG